MKKKLELNKVTVASLGTTLENRLLEHVKGGSETMVGMSCLTGMLCCITTDNP